MCAVKFGVVFPYNDPRTTAKLARQAEDAGWDGIFVGDAIWCQDPLIQLAAAAAATSRIRLGTEVLAMPLRDPRQLASESLALDSLSEGRLILGLGTGATWMGWQGFPDLPLDAKSRAEILDESIDILSLMHQRKQFDYDGRHFHVRLSQVDPMHYPPATVQQPRVPIWVPGIWPRMKNMRRALKCDGLFPQKMNAGGEFVEVTPTDVAQMSAFVRENRTLTTPFDIAVEGKTGGMERAQAQDTLRLWVDAGMTWWIESTWGLDEAGLAARIEQGPPK